MSKGNKKSNVNVNVNVREILKTDSKDADVSVHNMSTFDNQNNLPRLPIPKLASTLERFMQVVTPLLTPCQVEKTKSILQSFQEKDGPKLQTLLEAYENNVQKKGAFGSYIEEFWNDAYLVPNDPLVLNVNPYFLLEEDADAKIAKDQILRAASLAFNSLKFVASVKNETMAPDLVRGTSLCMDQFKSLFGACRIPSEERDRVQVDDKSCHVIVMFRNQIYSFQGLSLAPDDENNDGDEFGIGNCNDGDDGNNGEVKVIVNEADIAHILLSIVSDGKRTTKAASVQKAIGVLTTLPRNSWAKARQYISKLTDRNTNNFKIIDSGLFVLALDEFMPINVHEAAANMLHGTHMMVSSSTDEESNITPSTRTIVSPIPSLIYQGGTCCNRFYDKLQIIVCEDGSAGINFEHSAVDGHTTLRFVSDVFAETIVAFAKSVTQSIYRGDCPIPSIIHAKVSRAAQTNNIEGKDKNEKSFLDTNPKKLTFDFDGEICNQIVYAESKLGDAVSADDTYVLEWKGFGKNLIVHNSLSPDSFVQMTILIAYYKLYGDIVNSYESVLTKQFFHGRTEAMRSTTSFASNLMKCWTNPKTRREEKLNALSEATRAHSKRTKQASQGMGVDRHLFALKCIGEKNNVHSELFSSEAWKALNHTVISTSNCGNPSLRLFGFGPVVPDGFGIGYIIKDNGLQYGISSKHRQTMRYALSLKETLLEMQDLLEPMNAAPVGIRRTSIDNGTITNQILARFGGLK